MRLRLLRRTALAWAFAALAIPAFAAAVAGLGEYYSSGTATTTAATVTLSATVQFPMVVVINDSTTIAMHVAGDGADATTSSPKVAPGERYELPPPKNNEIKGRSTISVIAASSTVAYRVYGLP